MQKQSLPEEVIRKARTQGPLHGASRTPRSTNRTPKRSRGAGGGVARSGEAEELLLLGRPFVLRCWEQRRSEINKLPLSEATQIGTLKPGDFLSRSLAVDKPGPMLSCLFAMVGGVELEARRRIARQVKRIGKHRAGHYSANRLDDHAEIGKNVESLQREVEAVLARSKSELGKTARFGHKVLLIHLESKQVVGVREREQGCQRQLRQYVPLELCLGYGAGALFEVAPFYSHQKEGHAIRQKEAFTLLYHDDHAYAPLLSHKQSVPLSAELSSYFHFQNPLTAIPQRSLALHLFHPLAGASFLLKHQQQDLFLSLIDQRRRNRVLRHSHAFRAKVIAYRLRRSGFSFTHSGISDLDIARRKNSILRRGEELLAETLQEAAPLRPTQHLLRREGSFRSRDFDLFMVSQKRRERNLARLVWEALPWEENPRCLVLHHLASGIYVGPFVVDGQPRPHQNLIIELLSLRNQRLVLEQSTLHLSRLRLLPDPDPRAVVAFSFTPLPASIDLKVRHAAKTSAALLASKSLGQFQAGCEEMARFLGNLDAELVAPDQEPRTVSLRNQSILAELQTMWALFPLWRELQHTSAFEDPAGASLALNSLLSLYVEQNKENAKDAMVYWVEGYLLAAPEPQLFLVQKILQTAEPHFDYFEATLTRIAQRLLIQVRNSKDPSSVLDTLAIIAKVLARRNKAALAGRLFAPILTEQTLLVGELHAQLAGGGRESREAFCKRLAEKDSRFTESQLRFFAGIQEFLVPGFKNKEVSRLLKVLRSYCTNSGEVSAGVKAGIIHLLRSLLLKNELLLFQAPCAVRLGSARCFDLARAERLSEKNAIELAQIDGLLLAQPLFGAERSYLLEETKLTQCHVELLELLATLAKVCSLQPLAQGFFYQHLSKFLGFWRNKSLPRAALAPLFPKIIPLDLKLLVSRAAGVRAGLDGHAGLSELPFLARAYSHALLYLHHLRPPRPPAKPPLGDRLISASCCFFRTLIRFEADAFLSDVPSRPSTSNIFRVFSTPPEACQLLGAQQEAIVERVAVWVEQAVTSPTKDEVLSTLAELASLRQTCVQVSRRALWFTGEESRLKAVVQSLPELAALVGRELAQWESLDAWGEEDVLRGCSKQDTLARLASSLHRLEEAFSQDFPAEPLRMNTPLIETPTFRGGGRNEDSQSGIPLVKVSEGSVFTSLERGECLRRVQAFFREIGGHALVLQVVTTCRHLLQEAIQKLSDGEQSAGSELVLEVFTRSFGVLRRFVRKNSANIELISLDSIAPHFGEMYLLQRLNSPRAVALEEEMVRTQTALFSATSVPRANDPQLMQRYVSKLRVLRHKSLLKVFAKLLRVSMEPRVIDLLVSHLISLRNSRRDTLHWPDVRRFLTKVQRQLAGRAFRRVVRKLHHFANYIRREEPASDHFAPSDRMLLELDTFVDTPLAALPRGPVERAAESSLDDSKLLEALATEKRQCLDKVLAYRTQQNVMARLGKAGGRAMALFPKLMATQLRAKKETVLSEILRFVSSETAPPMARLFFAQRLEGIAGDFSSDGLLFKLVETVASLLGSRGPMLAPTLKVANRLLAGDESERVQERLECALSEEARPLAAVQEVLAHATNYVQMKGALPESKKDLAFLSLAFLRLLCENHHAALQELIGQQGFVLLVTRLLRSALSALHAGSAKHMPLTREIAMYSRGDTKKRKVRPSVEVAGGGDTAALMECAELAVGALIQFVQGPCAANQERVLKAEVFKSTKLLFQDLRFSFRGEGAPMRGFNARLLRLKGQAALLVTSLLEGRPQRGDPLSKAIASEVFVRDLEFLLGYSHFLFQETRGGAFLLDAQYFPQEKVADFRLESAFQVFFLLLKLAPPASRSLPAPRQAARASCSCSGCKRAPNAELEVLNKGAFLGKYEQHVSEGTRFLQTHCCSVEVAHESAGILVAHFPKLPSLQGLSAQQKEDFLYSLSTTNQDFVKPESIAFKGQTLMEEVAQEYALRSYLLAIPLIGLLVSRWELWKKLGFLMNFLQNVLMLLSFTHENGNSPDRPVFLFNKQYPIGPLLTTLAWLALVLALLGQLPSAIYRIPYHRAKVRAKAGLNSSRSSRCLIVTWSVVRDLHLVYNFLYILFAILGVAVHPFFFGFHLTFPLVRSADMRNILRAIHISSRQAFLILMFFFIAEYLYSLVAFQHYQDEVRQDRCISLLSCMLTYVDQTFKNNGGVGLFLDMSQDADYRLQSTADFDFGRVLYDLSFNILILIILIELYAAVLINTFSAMRAEKYNLERLMHNQCLVCGRSRSALEAQGIEFALHTARTHNIFSYVRFLAFLRRKDPHDYTGLESYVAAKNRAFDFSWIPRYHVPLPPEEDEPNKR